MAFYQPHADREQARRTGGLITSGKIAELEAAGINPETNSVRTYMEAHHTDHQTGCTDRKTH